MKKNVALLFFALLSLVSLAQEQRFSTAGFYLVEDSPRTVESMNPGWYLHRGAIDTGANGVGFDHSEWEKVSLPNGIEVLPVEASGGINYRDEVWYRKNFFLDAKKYEGKRLVLYFEGIMGKSKVWLNGGLIAEHFGGYLPIVLDITDEVVLGGDNLLAVWADNSDDPIYPPGKPQATLDFCYFGGIYRDCWLVSTSKGGYITDQNMSEDMGGGVMIHFTEVDQKSAKVNLKVNLGNDTKRTIGGKVEFSMGDGVPVSEVGYSVKRGGTTSVVTTIEVKNPKLWSPEHPNLYDLDILVKDRDGVVVDGYRLKVGIRTFEFSPTQGFILNGNAYPRKLIGANRHQDFALVGNALSNSLHWRDAQKLKDAGMEIIRNAHYPQDPAFMDACDALGLFVIENTPGWQFWNEEPIFQERVYDDIAQMVRRDRNRPSVIMWEPILNETWYPDDFAHAVHNIVKREYPYFPNYTATDLGARGNEYLDIKFCHPSNGDPNWSPDHIESTSVTFTREFGDNVDNWNSHNSPSRVAIQWGEIPQLIQAKGYIKPDYRYTSVDAIYRASINHVGGTLWHSFDHQRGYHPDPFYGGIMTSFRRPKYSYYAFMSQALWQKPMVYIANLMTPFSPHDVTVYSNCDEVHLYTQVGDSIRVYKRDAVQEGAPSPIITFKGAFDVMKDKELNRSRRVEQSFLLAKAYNNGELVAEHKVVPTRRTTKINLLLDTMSINPVANGGDLVVVVAQIIDDAGNIKRLNDQWVKFSIEGEGEIICDPTYGKNISKVTWGEASAIVRTTTNPGKIKVTAQIVYPGDHTPVTDTLEFETTASKHNLIYDPKAIDAQTHKNHTSTTSVPQNLDEKSRANLQKELKKVEKQQAEFGEKI